MIISPEARFITHCVREPDAYATRTLHAAATSVRDWAWVTKAAVRHHVAAYVEQAIARAGVAVPDTTRSTLHTAGLEALTRVLRLDDVLARLLPELSGRGVPVIVLKGPALARMIYPAAALRPYGDIDLSIRAEHEQTVESVLRAAGFAERVYAAEAARLAHAGHVHEGAGFHRQFIAQDSGVMVEVHRDPLQLGLQPACEEGRWQRAIPVPELRGALMLCAEDQLVHLSLHAHKHGFERLIWLKDIDLLLRARGPRLDWALVHAVARREGVTGSVWYTLWLARLLLGTPVPPGQLRRFRPAPPVRILYRLVWPPDRIQELGGHMRRRAVQFHAAESLRGMAPTLILMGRRRTRVRAMTRYLLGRFRQNRVRVAAAGPRGTTLQMPPPPGDRTGVRPGR